MLRGVPPAVVLTTLSGSKPGEPGRGEAPVGCLPCFPRKRRGFGELLPGRPPVPVVELDV